MFCQNKKKNSIFRYWFSILEKFWRLLLKSLARIESFWVFNLGFNSLMKGISQTRQSNLDLHFFKTENCLSTKSVFNRPCCFRCLSIAEYLCTRIRASTGSPDIFQASPFQLLKLENLLRWPFSTLSFKICWLIRKRTFSSWIENGIQFANHEKKSKKKNKDFKSL